MLEQLEEQKKKILEAKQDLTSETPATQVTKPNSSQEEFRDDDSNFDEDFTRRGHSTKRNIKKRTIYDDDDEEEGQSDREPLGI